MFRLVLGLVVAIICALATAYVAGFIFFAFALGGQADWKYGALVAWGASFFLTPAILILTIPLHRLAIKLRRVQRREYAFVGALVGMCVFLAVQLLTSIKALEFPGQMIMPALVIAPLLGAAAALGFWIVTRPDHTRVS
jgi:hypothetical protein